MSETTNIVDTPEAKEAFLVDVPVATETQVTPVKQDFADKGYTEEDLKKVREQEKSKLYPQIDSLKEELNLLKKEREERLAESERLRQEAESEAKRKAEAEMDTRQLLELKEKEWEEKLSAEKLERERAFSLLERERQYAELTEYRTRRIAEEQENIMPELVDLISGNTPEEIENSITGLRERSSRILDSAQQAMQSARREMTGSRVTSPPSGPMDNNSGQQQFTAEQIASMSVTEYAKYRDTLLGKASNSRNKGIFG
jgi:predicted RNase H-like nuclease (RuvC/YqgF family)